MPLIDAHVHPCFRYGEIRKRTDIWGVDFSPDGLERELRAARVERFVAFPDVYDMERSNEEVRAFAQARPGRAVALFGVPEEVPRDLDARIERGGYRGIKLFPGYQPRFINDAAWRRVFEVATGMRIPVVIHTGDPFVFRPGPRVKYAHPLPADDVAVDFPDCTIVLAHAGQPWVADACEVAYKNANVFLDLSAWWVTKPRPLERRIMAGQLRYVAGYIGPEKILFGSDWPIVPIPAYRRFFDATPLPGRRDIYYNNALRIFWGGKEQDRR